MARILANVAVNQRVLRQLLRRRERLETEHALVVLLVGAMTFLGVTLHVRLVLKLLQHVARTQHASHCQRHITRRSAGADLKGINRVSTHFLTNKIQDFSGTFQDS